MSSEGDRLVNRHSHDHSNCDHDHEHTEETKSFETTAPSKHRSFNEMDRPKVQINRYIYLIMLIHLPLSYIVNYYSESLSDEERRLKFQEGLENMKSPFNTRSALVYFGKSFIINFFDIVVISYLFRPMAKMTKQQKEDFQNLHKEYHTIQKKMRSGLIQPDKTVIDSIIKRRQYLGKVLMRKRQSYNLIVSEYIKFCFSTNTIMMGICYAMIFVNYLVFVKYKIYGVGFFFENAIVSALYLRMILFIYTRYDAKNNSSWRKALISLFLGFYVTGRLSETYSISLVLDTTSSSIIGIILALISYKVGQKLNNTWLFSGCRRLVYSFFTSIKS